MSRRVYWRAPDGRPYKNDDGRHSPVAMLREIGLNSKVNSDGSISSTDFSFLTHSGLISSSTVILLEKGVELCDEEKELIIDKAISAAIKRSGGSKAIAPNEVLLEAEKLLTNHLALPISKFVLVTSLSIREFPVRIAKVFGCQIQPVNRSRSRFVYTDKASFLKYAPAL